MFEEQQEKWIKRTEEIFLRYGIKSITMDDVARELGISKKTLYQFVESKDDLVNKVVERHIEMEKSMCANQFSLVANAIEEMFIVIEVNAQQMSQMKANIVYDMQKYHREAWEKMESFQHGFLYTVVRANLERGISEGLYRADLEVDITAKLHIAQSFTLFDEKIFPQGQYKRDVLFKEYLTHYLHGIVNDKGREIIKAKLT